MISYFYFLVTQTVLKTWFLNQLLESRTPASILYSLSYINAIEKKIKNDKYKRGN